MKITFKNSQTFTRLGVTDYRATALPEDGDVVFYKSNDGQRFSGVCKGRIFDFATGAKVSILLTDIKIAE